MQDIKIINNMNEKIILNDNLSKRALEGSMERYGLYTKTVRNNYICINLFKQWEGKEKLSQDINDYITSVFNSGDIIIIDFKKVVKSFQDKVESLGIINLDYMDEYLYSWISLAHLKNKKWHSYRFPFIFTNSLLNKFPNKETKDIFYFQITLFFEKNKWISWNKFKNTLKNKCGIREYTIFNLISLDNRLTKKENLIMILDK